LAGTEETRVPLHKQSNVRAVGGCELTLHQGENDRGASKISPLHFCMDSFAGGLASSHGPDSTLFARGRDWIPAAVSTWKAADTSFS